MKLTREGIRQREQWEKAGIRLPGYDVDQVTEKAVKAPRWVHFGIGNIFRIFIGGIADGLLEQGLLDRGLTCVETFDYDVVDQIYEPYDNLALSVILRGDEPAYTGLIGSRRRVKGLMAQLEGEGYSREKMDRICTPIGLNIGAVTPEEIAISILAELIAYRRMPEHTQGRPCSDSDLTLDMMQYLAENEEPKAIVTVIETKGSTPRGAGAKMTVDPRGSIVGTIGGGCSEGNIIRDAIDIIGTGSYRVMDIDMTGEVAEEEGMVCGGTMKVLIEDGSEA